MKIILQIIFQIICNYYIILCSGVKSNSNSNINSKFPKEDLHPKAGEKIIEWEWKYGSSLYDTKARIKILK